MARLRKGREVKIVRIVSVTLDTTAQTKISIVSGNNQTAEIGSLLPEPFNASALAGAANSIVVDSGNNQIGATGQPLPKPFVAVVIDQGSNRLGGVLVTFRVKEGGGNFGGQAETVVTTDSDGRAATVLTLGLAPQLCVLEAIG